MTLLLPAPRLPDPTAVPALRWGAVGTGIGARVVASMHAHTTQCTVAWAGRDAARTEAAARRHGVERHHTDVRALLEADDLDAVYIATPHPLHHDLALAAIAAGKHVLVEKPIAMDALEAARITEAAQVAGVLAMEAMWTRYLPQTDVLCQVLADGLIGDPQLVRAAFGSVVPYDADHRLWNPALGGGALLDVGVYPVALASMVLGPPVSIHATGTLAPSGVDATAHLLLAGARGAAAALSTSLMTPLPASAEVVGSAGRAELAAPFYGPSALTVTVGPEGHERVAAWTDRASSVADAGFAHQLTAFAHYVAQGRVESPLHPHAETISIMGTIDEARRQLAALPLEA